jgi:hypothetical protein
MEAMCGLGHMRSVKIWKHKKIVIFKAMHSMEKNNLVLDGRILLKWISRMTVTTVWITLNWESDSRDIAITVMNL